MPSLLDFATMLGGAFSYASADRSGFPRKDIARAVASGDLIRVRNGWFAIAGAHPDVVQAVRVGGTLTGASVARTHGVWMLKDDTLHVRVPRTASRLASPHHRERRLDLTGHDVCVHYSDRAGTAGCRDLLPGALIEMFRCGDVRAAAVALDSAREKGFILDDDLDDMRQWIPREKLSVFDRSDPGAQSGLETLVRLLLASRRVRYRSQVEIAGAGRVDLLIGDRLVLELDGEQFHTGVAFEADRCRDFALVMQGYLVLRLSYRQVMERWDQVTDGLADLIRRGEHRWGVGAKAGPFPFAG